MGVLRQEQRFVAELVWQLSPAYAHFVACVDW
jgi:hypothetical protein